jgi:type I restriction enzyme, S subunit
MRSNYKRLGDYIEEIKVRNSDLKAKDLLGINIDKFFMPSVANIVGTDMSVYKIVKKNQFACNRMHVGRDYRLPISMSKSDEQFMVSPAYDVFEIRNPELLFPEYLMMWFSRREFDRNAWFYTDADVRGGLHWKALCDMQLPIPTITKQREIVKEYNTVVNRIKLNQKLIQKLEETAQAIYKQWFVDFEFPNENGLPYKSNGGEMVFNEELEKEVPKCWEYNELGKITTIKAGVDKPEIFSDFETESCCVPVYSNSSANEGLFGFTNKATVSEKSITISARGAIIGYTVLRLNPFVPIVRLIVVIPKHEYQVNYIFDCIKKFKYNTSGWSAQGQLTVPDISSFKVITPNSDVLKKYQNITSEVIGSIEVEKNQNKKLEELKDLLLSKLATIEN